MIQGLGYLAVEVTDLDAAQSFYTDLLGFEFRARDRWPGAAASTLMKAGAQHLFLVQNPEKALPDETGRHQAYRVSVPARQAIGRRLEAEGIAVKSYEETRLAESGDNFYVFDPSGNRVQLVAAGNTAGGAAVTGIDHVCVEDFDMQWAEAFYAHILNLPIDYWHGLRTEDYVHAQDWAGGRRDLAPGCCRMVRYYREIPGQNRMQPRPTLQIYLRAGREYIGIYMATDDYAEPPEQQLRGGSCVGFAIAPGGLDDLAAMLEGAGRRFLGPVDEGDDAPLGRTIYCRDTGGNFLAFYENA